jgi:hypothetical protein
MKNALVPLSLTVLSLVILSSCLLSYWRLDSVPYGFHVDELSGALDIQCMATEGVDAHNVRYPLFANLNYGSPKPPTYIYPGILWGKFFGYSVPSLRAFTVTVYFWGIAGLFLSARLLFGWRYAFLTATVACLSPWTWVLARTGFESLFAMAFLIWGMYFFLRPPKFIATVMAGLFFAAAMYAYPPFRLNVPLMLLALIVYTWQSHRRGIVLWVAFVLSMLLPSIPMLVNTLNGNLQERFNSISIFSKTYLQSINSSGSLKDLIEIFVRNYFTHFSWDFLFVHGDPSLIHSTCHFGILSWLDMAALLAGTIWMGLAFFKKGWESNPLAVHWGFMGFLVVNILIGVVPSALTTDLPNSLRITGSWPFVCLLSGFLLLKACERLKGLWVVVCLLSVCFAASFFKVCFQTYPQESKGMFSFWALDQAKQMKTDEDWLKFLLIYRYQDYTARYYMMQYRGFGCTQARQVWEGMRDYLKAHGQY